MSKSKKEVYAEGDEYHSRAGEDIPAKANAIAIFHLAPLLLDCFVVH